MELSEYYLNVAYTEEMDRLPVLSLGEDKSNPSFVLDGIKEFNISCGLDHLNYDFVFNTRIGEVHDNPNLTI